MNDDVVVNFHEIIEPVTGVTAIEVAALCGIAHECLGGEINQGHPGMKMEESGEVFSGTIRRLVRMTRSDIYTNPENYAERVDEYRDLADRALWAVENDERFAIMSAIAFGAITTRRIRARSAE